MSRRATLGLGLLFAMPVFAQRDDFRHLREPWKDLPEVPAVGVRGGWESLRRGERWRNYADWRRVEAEWSELTRDAALYCEEESRRGIDNAATLFREHVARFERVCLPIAGEESYVCRYERERLSEAFESLSLARSILENCSLEGEEQSPWKFFARPELDAGFRKFSRETHSESGLLAGGRAALGVERDFGRWGFRAQGSGSWRREGDFSLPGFGVELHPYWSSARYRLAASGFFHRATGLYAAARDAALRDQRSGGSVEWAWLEGAEPRYALRYGLSVRTTTDQAYDGLRHDFSALLEGRVRLGVRMLSSHALALKPGFLAISLDGVFRVDRRVRLEIGFEEKASESFSTSLRPRLRAVAKVTSTSGAAWETDGFSPLLRYDAEVFAESLPDDESLSPAAQKTAVGGDWTWHWSSLRIPLRVAFFDIDLGSDFGGRDFGYELGLAPSWSLTKEISLGSTLAFRNSNLDPTGLASETWIHEAGASVWHAGLFLRGNW